MARTYTISPDVFLVILKDEEGNTYSCTPADTIELDGYTIEVPGIYDWYLYFNTYAEWTKHRMDERFKAKMFHRKGKELAKIMRMQMLPEDDLFYYRSIDDDSGVVLKRSRIRRKETYTEADSLQIVRILIGQMISFAIAMVYFRKSHVPQIRSKIMASKILLTRITVFTRHPPLHRIAP